MTVVIPPKVADIGFPVQRLLPRGRHQRVGPFIFFDHMGPAFFEAGTTRGDVRPHPHIGLATVTYLFSGALMHRDSLGVEQRIEPGAINLMTAGRGITHSERIPADIREQGIAVQGIQIWLALPVEQEETEPDFSHYEASQLPEWSDEHSSIRVLLGEACGERSPVRTASPTTWLDIQVNNHGRCELPASRQELAVYLASGSADVNGTPLQSHHLMLLDPGTPITLSTAEEPARLMLIGGDSLPGERFINWNFVSSSRERIDRAREDWRGGRFPVISGDEDEFMPLPG